MDGHLGATRKLNCYCTSPKDMQNTDLHSSQRIAKRAVLIGTILIIANSYWIAYVEMIWHTAHLTTVAMSVNVMFGILAMTLLNIAVRRIFSAYRSATARFARGLQHACCG